MTDLCPRRTGSWAATAGSQHVLVSNSGSPAFTWWMLHSLCAGWWVICGSSSLRGSRPNHIWRTRNWQGWYLHLVVAFTYWHQVFSMLICTSRINVFSSPSISACYDYIMVDRDWVYLYLVYLSSIVIWSTCILVISLHYWRLWN